MLKEIKVKWTGEEALIMHRGDLADPMDRWAKLISAQAKRAKASKSEPDAIELYRLEWYGSAYVDSKIGFVIPTDNVTKVIIEGARKAKLGKQVEASVFVEGIPPNGHHEAVKLDFPGPQEQEAMWKLFLDGKDDFVFKKTLKVAKTRIVRCRPIFRQWSILFVLHFDPSVISQDQLVEAMKQAGHLVGMGDWHPRYGTFKSEIIR